MGFFYFIKFQFHSPQDVDEVEPDDSDTEEEMETTQDNSRAASVLQVRVMSKCSWGDVIYFDSTITLINKKFSIFRTVEKLIIVV